MFSAMFLYQASVGQAALLTFGFSEPVILSTDGTLSYDAGTGQFHSQSQPLTYNSSALSGGFVFFSGTGLATINLVVDSGGNFVSNGSGFKLTGAIDFDLDGVDDVFGDDSQPLVFGSIVAFGAESAGSPTRIFNGLYTIDGGKLTETFALSGGGTMFGGFPVGGLPGGFELHAENVTSGTLGDHTADYSSDSVKQLTGPVLTAVPEPGTFTLCFMAVVIGAMASRIRRADTLSR